MGGNVEKSPATCCSLHGLRSSCYSWWIFELSAILCDVDVVLCPKRLNLPLILTDWSRLHSWKPFSLPTWRQNRSQWPRSLSCATAAIRLLGLRVRITLGEQMSVFCECCVLSGRGLYDRPRGVLPRVMSLSVSSKPRQWGGPGTLGCRAMAGGLARQHALQQVNYSLSIQFAHKVRNYTFAIY